MSSNSAPSFAPGSTVVGMVMRFQSDSASFVMQLPGNVPAVLSAYDLTDEEFDALSPGAMCTAIIDRVEHIGGHISVVLHKAPQPIPV